MSDFHRTGYGRTFFEHQLPRLIETLGTVGSELKRQNNLKEKELQDSGEPNGNDMFTYYNVWFSHELSIEEVNQLLGLSGSLMTEYDEQNRTCQMGIMFPVSVLTAIPFIERVEPATNVKKMNG